MLGRTHAQTCLGHQVAERQCWRQAVGLTQQTGLNLGRHHFLRGMIPGDVMPQLMQEPAIVLHIMRKAKP